MNKIQSSIKSIFESERIFIFLVIFRWASLFPPILAVALKSGEGQIFSPEALLGIAFLANIFISLFNRQLNNLVVQQPLFLAVDLFFTAGILVISGGRFSPYFLYALSPLLAGAFFFRTRGAILTSLIFTPLYFIGIFLFQRAPSQIDVAIITTQITGIWLIPILFAYASTLLNSIRSANKDLVSTHRQLEIIHDLTVLLQAAPDLISVEERVLGAVTKELGYSKAVVAMVDPALEELGNWLVYPSDESMPKTKPVALRSENGEIIKAILKHKSFTTSDQDLINDKQLNTWFIQNTWHVIPLYLREHPVGVLMVDGESFKKDGYSTLITVANQAALALGTTTLCIDRARRLAIETERNRIARDIHDTVAQSLFGIVYSLDACINMLPSNAGEVKTELMDLRSLANTTHDEVRRSIFDLWPSALTMELFMADLTNYIGGYTRPNPFSIVFNHNGDFNTLPSGIRRMVYRIAQEALANSAKHSGAQSAKLCLTVTDDEVFLVVSDEGKGFDSQAALSRNINREHFGLRGIQERAIALGGDFEVNSNPNAGARVMINFPINGHSHG